MRYERMEDQMKDMLYVPAGLKKIIVLLLLAASMLAVQPLCTRAVFADCSPSQAQTQAQM
jgi:hypothetical protein